MFEKGGSLLDIWVKKFVTIQAFSPPVAAHPGMEWVRALPPQATKHAPTPYP